MNWQEANERARQQQSAHLVAKVAARNLLSQLINTWDGKLKAVFQPFLNQKVSLVTGGKPVKVKEALEKLQLPNTPEIQIFVTCDEYAPHARFRVCKCFTYGNHESGCCYMEQTISLGAIRNNILTEIYGPYTTEREDFTVEFVLATRKALREAQEAVSKAQSALDMFGIHDNH